MWASALPHPGSTPRATPDRPGATPRARHSIAEEPDIAFSAADSVVAMRAKKETQEEKKASRQAVSAFPREARSNGVIKTGAKPAPLESGDAEDAEAESLPTTKASPLLKKGSGNVDDPSEEDVLKASILDLLATCKLLPVEREASSKHSDRSRMMKRPGAMPAGKNQASWRTGGMPAGKNQELWRQPGDVEDGRYSVDTISEKRWEKEFEIQKRLAGGFVVSASPNGSLDLSRLSTSLCASSNIQELPSRPPSRAPPAHCPYDDAWRVGAPPVGKWVLDSGIPRVVSQRRHSLDAWFCKDDGKKKGQAKDEPAALPAKGSTAQSMVQRNSSEAVAFLQFRDASPSCSSSDDGSSTSREVTAGKTGDDDGEESNANLAQSCRSGEDSPAQVVSKTNKGSRDPLASPKSPRKSAKYNRKSVAKHDGDLVEEICEIFRSLDVTGLDDSEALPRFSWVAGPSSTSSSFACAPRSDSVASEFGSLPSLPIGGLRSSIRQSLKRRKQSTTSRRGSSRHASVASSASGSSSRGRTDSRVSSRSIREAAGARRRVAQEQRSELKQLQQTILASDQQAFDAEVWESCGIEAEHLKRQEFATLLQSGLFNISGKNADQQNQDEPAQVEEQRPAASAVDKKRVTIALGVNFKAAASDDEDEEDAGKPKLKAQAERRKSALKVQK